MIERRVIERTVLINKLNNMRYEHLSEQQIKHLFITLGKTIQVEEEGDKDAV